MLVRPILEYAAPVWDPHLQQDIDALEKVQRRAARFVLTRHHNTSSVSEMLTILNWPTLAQRRQDARLRLLYKALKGQSTVHNNRLKFAPKRDRRSHDQQLSRVQGKSDYRNMSFLPRTIRDWNNLPATTVSAPSLDIFTQRMSRA